MSQQRAMCAVAIAAAACAVQTRGDTGFGSGAGEDSSGPGATSGGEAGFDSQISADSDTGGAEGNDDATKFDTPNEFDLGDAGEAGHGEGCQKVDFVFVIDNSGSMGDEQQNLANSFPGFIAEIQDTVASDYHILIIDTDAGGGGGCTMSIVGPSDCEMWCDTQCTPGCACDCNGVACPTETTDVCDDTLGAGKVDDQNNDPCGVAGDARFMTHTQPDIEDAFQCVATVGTVGDGNERPMQALSEAVTTQVDAGSCNEGFLRDDAILVVTLITDEEDNGKSPGDPASWAQVLADAKGGDEKAVVPLALVGDSDAVGGLCAPYDGAGNGAEPAPRLRQWAELFTHGRWASVCESDYTSFFEEAVEVIDTACDEFVPEG